MPGRSLQNAAASLCLVEDDEAVRDGLTILLETEGFGVRAYPSAQAFLAQADAPCDCLITDVQTPGMDGLELLATVKAGRPNLPVIVMTARIDPERTARALSRGAAAVLAKPCPPEALFAALDQALGAAAAGTDARGDR